MYLAYYNAFDIENKDRPHYNLVVDEDVKKPTKQTNENKEKTREGYHKTRFRVYKRTLFFNLS